LSLAIAVDGSTGKVLENGRPHIEVVKGKELTNVKPVVKKPIEAEREEAKTWPIWEKEESKFPWNYSQQERCLIIEGKAVVKTPEGDVEFGAGDYVMFPKGLNCTWEIKEKIKKFYNLK